ncbi:MAG TPA: efflux RND transporter permease subunit, partial [Vicinamibacteria bacterium]
TPEVRAASSFIGLSQGGPGAVNRGAIFTRLHARAERRRSQHEVVTELRERFARIPGLSVFVVPFSGLPTGQGGKPFQFVIQNPDFGALRDHSQRLVESLRQRPGFTDVDSSLRLNKPELRVGIDRNKAAALGVSMADLGQTINAAIGGTRVGKYKEAGRRFDIRVRLLAPQRERPEDIQRLFVRTASGQLVRLSDLVAIEQQPTLQAITRKDRERAITVFANVTPGASQAEALDKALDIATRVLPDGYRATPSGSSQAFRESFASLLFAFAMGLIVAYMVLAAQFNAFTHPFTVLLALPFSISGALIALYLSGQSLNVYSMLGAILLMGIAKKNSILLVDFTNQMRAQGVERHEAIFKACPVRLRPILMTSTATIAGAIPPALALGPGAELQRPMALALVGGMAVSTLFTLFVVPAAYSLLDDAVQWNAARRRRGVGLVGGLGEVWTGLRTRVRRAEQPGL